MKNFIATFFALILCANTSFALSTNDIPDEFQIIEHWVSLTTSFDIQTKTQKLGTLYRKFFSLLLTYEFFDPFDNKLATARARFFSLTAHFDVYDNHDVLLGSAEERLFSFFPTFDIYSPDTVTRLAHASMNFWGTTFTIYDPVTNREMANIHRSFFRLKNDWTFHVVDRALLMSKNIDPRVLLTVAAFQGDKEYWKNNDNNNSLKGANQAKSMKQSKELIDKIDLIRQQQGFTKAHLDSKGLEALAKKLEKDFLKSEGDSFQKLSNQEQINHFVDYALNMAQSNDMSQHERESILYLLKMRLQG